MSYKFNVLSIITFLGYIAILYINDCNLTVGHFFISSFSLLELCCDEHACIHIFKDLNKYFLIFLELILLV